MEQRKGGAKRHLVLRDAVEECFERIGIPASVKQEQAKRREKPPPLNLNGDVFQLGVRVHKRFNEEKEKCPCNQNAQ